jgi:hypothetical protein
MTQTIMIQDDMYFYDIYEMIGPSTSAHILTFYWKWTAKVQLILIISNTHYQFPFLYVHVATFHYRVHMMLIRYSRAYSIYDKFLEDIAYL